jgi:hypothetical protein
MSCFASGVFILFVVLGCVEGTPFAPEWVERSCLLYFSWVISIEMGLLGGTLGCEFFFTSTVPGIYYLYPSFFDARCDVSTSRSRSRGLYGRITQENALILITRCSRRQVSRYLSLGGGHPSAADLVTFGTGSPDLWRPPLKFKNRLAAGHRALQMDTYSFLLSVAICRVKSCWTVADLTPAPCCC